MVIEKGMFCIRKVFGLIYHPLQRGVGAPKQRQPHDRQAAASYSYSPTTETWIAPRLCIRARTSLAPGSGGSVSTLSQNPCVLADRKPSTSKTGWYGCGSRRISQSPKKMKNADIRTPLSKVIGTNAGVLWGGRPPTLIGQSTALVSHWARYPSVAPPRPPTSASSGTLDLERPSASVVPSRGKGE